MALGAVPLIVRVPFPEEDFMQGIFGSSVSLLCIYFVRLICTAWIGYPGPVFESWKEALLFVSSVSIRYVLNISVLYTYCSSPQ